MSPMIFTFPRMNPNMSSGRELMGTSFARGFPRLVIITGSHFECTSSITARHLVLKTLAGIVLVFISSPRQYDHT